MSVVDELYERQDSMIEKYGWLVHFVFDAPPTGANCHTHGIAPNFGHPDLQIVLNLDSRVIHSIISSLFKRIEVGERFTPGQVTTLKGFNDNLKAKFVACREGDRDLLRVILPDPVGNVDQSALEKDSIYYQQYFDLVEGGNWCPLSEEKWRRTTPFTL